MGFFPSSSGELTIEQPKRRRTILFYCIKIVVYAAHIECARGTKWVNSVKRLTSNGRIYKSFGFSQFCQLKPADSERKKIAFFFRTEHSMKKEINFCSHLVWKRKKRTIEIKNIHFAYRFIYNLHHFLLLRGSIFIN